VSAIDVTAKAIFERLVLFGEPHIPGLMIPAENPVNSNQYGFEPINTQARASNYCFQ